MRTFNTIAPVVLALLLLAGMTMPAAAQGAAPGAVDVDYEGVEKAYSRVFTIDFVAMYEAEDPESLVDGWIMLAMVALEFDSEDHARAAFDQINDEAASGAAAGGVELEPVELDLEPDYTALRSVQVDEDGSSTSVLMITALDGRYVYLVTSATLDDEDPTELVTSTIAGMRTTDVSDDDEAFNEDGMSIGGLWAKLPSAETIQGEVETLASVNDVIYYPLPEGTPAA